MTVAKIEGVDVVLGAEQKKDLLQYLGDLQKHESGEALHFRFERYTFVCSVLFAWRPYPLLPESAGRLRLLLFLLHHSLCPRT